LLSERWQPILSAAAAPADEATPWPIDVSRLADAAWRGANWGFAPGRLGGVLAQEGGGDAGGGILNQLLSNPLILPVGLLVIFYLTFIAPERRRRAEEAKMMASLKKNDRVVTVGGIHATVVSVGSDSDVVTLKIDESSNTRIKVNRSAIAKIVTPQKESKDKDEGQATHSAVKK
jgi:preprotein translocase subunit YajC